MEVFVVEHRQVDERDDGTWDCETVVMFVASTFAKALEYCANNILDELEDTESRASWFAICRNTVDLDDPCDGELIHLVGKYGTLDEQPYYGYTVEHRG